MTQQVNCFQAPSIHPFQQIPGQQIVPKFLGSKGFAVVALVWKVNLPSMLQATRDAHPIIPRPKYTVQNDQRLTGAYLQNMPTLTGRRERFVGMHEQQGQKGIANEIQGALGMGWNGHKGKARKKPGRDKPRVPQNLLTSRGSCKKEFFHEPAATHPASLAA
jgi:hypothetical protein